jgi:hypothetical protein
MGVWGSLGRFGLGAGKLAGRGIGAGLRAYGSEVASSLGTNGLRGGGWRSQAASKNTRGNQGTGDPLSDIFQETVKIDQGVQTNNQLLSELIATLKARPSQTASSATPGGPAGGGFDLPDVPTRRRPRRSWRDRFRSRQRPSPWGKRPSRLGNFARGAGRLGAKGLGLGLGGALLAWEMHENSKVDDPKAWDEYLKKEYGEEQFERLHNSKRDMKDNEHTKGTPLERMELMNPEWKHKRQIEEQNNKLRNQYKEIEGSLKTPANQLAAGMSPVSYSDGFKSDDQKSIKINVRELIFRADTIEFDVGPGRSSGGSTFNPSGGGGFQRVAFNPGSGGGFSSSRSSGGSTDMLSSLGAPGSGIGFPGAGSSTGGSAFPDSFSGLGSLPGISPGPGVGGGSGGGHSHSHGGSGGSAPSAPSGPPTFGPPVGSFSKTPGSADLNKFNPMPTPGGGSVDTAHPIPKSEGKFKWNRVEGNPDPSQFTKVKTAYGDITVRKDAAAAYKGFYDDLHKAGAPIKSIGSHSHRMKQSAGAGHNPGGGWSQHAHANATDIDNATSLSPAMRKWMAANPGVLESTKTKWGMKSPKGDEPHMEFGGVISPEARAQLETQYAEAQKGTQPAGATKVANASIVPIEPEAGSIPSSMFDNKATATKAASAAVGEGSEFSPYRAEQRAKYIAEIDANPALKQKLAVLLEKEAGHDPKDQQRVFESMLNRTYHEQGDRPDAVNRAMHNGFYGPMKGHETGSSKVDRDIARGRDPRETALFKGVYDKVSKGSNDLDGRSNQGMGSDRKTPWSPGEKEARRYMGNPDRGNVYYDKEGIPTKKVQADLAAQREYDAQYAAKIAAAKQPSDKPSVSQLSGGTATSANLFTGIPNPKVASAGETKIPNQSPLVPQGSTDPEAQRIVDALKPKPVDASPPVPPRDPADYKGGAGEGIDFDALQKRAESNRQTSALMEKPPAESESPPPMPAVENNSSGNVTKKSDTVSEE